MGSGHETKPIQIIDDMGQIHSDIEIYQWICVRIFPVDFSSIRKTCIIIIMTLSVTSMVPILVDISLRVKHGITICTYIGWKIIWQIVICQV